MDHHHYQQQQQLNNHSRPPSVDSVHLGSTYSGYFQSPQQQQQQHPPPPPPQHLQQNIPLVSQQNQQQQQYLPYQVPYSHGYAAAPPPQQQQQPQNFYPNSGAGGYAPPGPIVPGGNGQQQQQPLQPYQYNLSASAAAAAAAAAASASFQHHQQQQQNILSPLAQRHQFAVDGSTQPQQQSPGLYLQPQQPQQQQQWTGAIQPQHQQYLLQHPQAAAGMMALQQQFQQQQQQTSVPNDAYSLYVSQYYREYYRNYVQMYRHQQAAAAVKTKTPLKYGSRLVHARAAFSAHDNRLLVIDSPNSRVLVYDLAEIFTEQIYPHLYLQSLLLPVAAGAIVETGGEAKSGSSLLPFSSKDVALEWIRAKMLDYRMNYELKLILQVITMLYRQNGVVSGLDLSELLYKIVMGENGGIGAVGGNSFVSGGGGVGLNHVNSNGGLLANNNESTDSVLGGADRLSQTGSEAPMSLSMGGPGREALLAQLRQLLTRGQRRVAITFAQNNGLFDHALALTYLLSFQSGPAGGVGGSNLSGTVVPGGDCALMLATIRKFITASLDSGDPLYVFYSHLLQIATNLANSSSSGGGNVSANNSFSAGTPAQQPSQSLAGCAKIETLESFIILLANDIKFEKVEITNNSLKNLIDLMVALLKEEREYVLPDELFSDRFDCLLVNECLEFARFGGERLNPRLLLRKLEFAIELFDYGFVRPAIGYCEAIRAALLSDHFELKSLAENTAQMKASQLTQYLLPAGSILESSRNNSGGWEDEQDAEERRQFVLALWQYQMAKMLTRVDPACPLEAFDSPLIEPPAERALEEEEEEDDDDEVDVISQEEEEEEEEEEEQPPPPPVVQRRQSSKRSSTKVVKEAAVAPTSSKAKTATVVETAEKKVAEKQNRGSVGKEAAPKRAQLPPPPVQQRQQQKPLAQAPLPPPPVLEEISEEGVAGDEGGDHQQQHQQLVADSGSSGRQQMFGGGDQQQQQQLRQMMESNGTVDEQQQQQTVDAFKSLSLSSSITSEDVIDRSRSSVGAISTSATATFEPPPPPSVPPTRDALFGLPNSMPSSSLTSGPPSAFTPLSTTTTTAAPAPSVPSLPTPPATNLQQQPSFFMPPPPAASATNSYDTAAPFDFMSSGQVTSIPTYDPFPLEDHPADQQQQKSGGGSYMNDYSNYNSNSSNHQQQVGNHSGGSKQTEKKAAEGTSSSKPDSTKSSPSKNGGLLSSIFGIIKPKNQAILPDDKDPTIIFDPVLNKWVDKNASADGSDSSALPPPPKMLPGGGGGGGPSGAGGPPSTFAAGGPAMAANSTSTPQSTQLSNGVGPLFPPPSSSLGPSPTLPSSSSSPAPSFPSAPAPARAGGPGSQFRGRNRYIDVLQSNAKPPAAN